MAGYMVYWPGEQIRKLKKAKDTGPIRVVLGSVHAKMPSIAGVKPGDVIYPVTLEKGTLYAMARLPFAHRLAGHVQPLRHVPLGQLPPGAQGGDFLG